MSGMRQVMTQLKTDSRSAKLMKEKFAYVQGMKNVQVPKALSIKSGVIRAMQELKDQQYPVGPRTYGAAISIVGKVGLLDTAEQLWKETEMIRKKNKDPISSSLHNAMLYTRLRKVSNRPLATRIIKGIFRDMRTSRIYRDRYTYNTALKGLAQCKAHAACRDIIQQMCKEKISPDTVTYNTLITSCTTDESIQKVADEMKHSGVTPNTSSYTSMISVMVALGKMEEAAKWFIKATRDGMTGAGQARTLALGWEKQSNGHEILKLIQFLKDNKQHVGSEMYHCAMLAFHDTSFKKVAAVYQAMVHDDVMRCCRTYSIFIDAICKKLSRLPPNHPSTGDYVKAAKLALTSALQNPLCTNKPFISMARVYHAAGDADAIVSLCNKYDTVKSFPVSEEMLELRRSCVKKKAN